MNMDACLVNILGKKNNVSQTNQLKFVQNVEMQQQNDLFLVEQILFLRVMDGQIQDIQQVQMGINLMSPDNLSIKLIDISYVNDILNALTISRNEIEKYTYNIYKQLSKEGILDWIKKQTTSHIENTNHTFVSLNNDMFCGCCSLMKIDKYRANVGYWTSTPYTRKGYTTKFIEMLLNWAYENTQFHRFEFIMNVTNVGTINVAKNVGAELEGIQRDRIHKDGNFYDAYCYSIIKNESLINVS
jgi:RimJ/RimL family protein N-acetyltransferase